MSNNFVNRPLGEKIAKVKAAPEIAVQLIDNQEALIETMRTQIDVMKRIIKLYEVRTRIECMKKEDFNE